MILTGEQIRAGRAMLRMEQAELAERAQVSVETIKRLERIDGPVNALGETIVSIRRAFEAAGLAIIDEPATGVRWAVNRNAVIVDSLSSIIDRIVHVELEEEVKRDPGFFDRGPEVVVAKLATVLHSSMLDHIVRQVLPLGRP